jgi:hypothetical protein
VSEELNDVPDTRALLVRGDGRIAFAHAFGQVTEGEIHEVAQRVQARPVPDASAEWQAVEAHKDRIEACLTKKRPLRLTGLHALLARDGLEASYDTLAAPRCSS